MKIEEHTLLTAGNIFSKKTKNSEHKTEKIQDKQKEKYKLSRSSAAKAELMKRKQRKRREMAELPFSYRKRRTQKAICTHTQEKLTHLQTQLTRTAK